jgi:DNA repair exonuclease SbcCD ATPase subunit
MDTQKKNLLAGAKQLATENLALTEQIEKLTAEIKEVKENYVCSSFKYSKQIEKLTAENKKLTEIDHQLYSVRRDAELCEITGIEDISELEEFVKDAKKHQEQVKFYKDCFNQAVQERDYEHTRFLEEQSKRGDLEYEISSIAEEYLSTGDETLDDIRNYLEEKTDELTELKEQLECIEQETEGSSYEELEIKRLVEELECRKSTTDTQIGELEADLEKYKSMANVYGEYVEIVDEGCFTEWMKDKYPDEDWWDYGEAEEEEKEKQKIKETLPTPIIPYPRQIINGTYQECYETEEQEDEATARYFKNNSACDERAVKEFIMTYEEGQNSMIDKIKKFDDAKFHKAYWGYEKLRITDKNAIQVIGRSLNGYGGIELMRASYYLLSWDMKRAGMCIGSVPRVIEHYWDGIGSWMA